MTAKEILGMEMRWEDSSLKESIGDAIRDTIDEILCEDGTYDKIYEEHDLTEETASDYDFYSDPIWKEAWNKKVEEIASLLKL